jgi:hypothetical protein
LFIKHFHKQEEDLGDGDLEALVYIEVVVGQVGDYCLLAEQEVNDEEVGARDCKLDRQQACFVGDEEVHGGGANGLERLLRATHVE